MKSEEQNSETSSWFEAFFNLCNDAAFILRHSDSTLIAANSEGLFLTGRESSPFTDAPLREIIPAESYDFFCAKIKETLQSTEPVSFEGQLQHSGGSKNPCLIRAQRMKTPGNESLIALIFRDVSERARINEDINLRNIAIASMSSGVTIADARQPDLPLIYVNEGFLQLTGYTAREAVGRSCRFLQGEDREQPGLIELRAALREARTCTVQLRNYRKDGSLFHNELHISPVLNENNELTHFIGIQLDITDRVKRRELLIQSEKRYRQLADAVDDLILRRKRDGTLDFISSACQRLTGIARDGLEKTNFYDWVHPEDRIRVKEQAEKVLTRKNPEVISFRLATATRDYLWIESRDTIIEPESQDDPLGIVSVCRDITLRKKAEEEIQQALAREKELNEIKSRFISMVSHEFRTPMTGVQASASLLFEYADSLSEEKKIRHHRNIDHSLKRMNNLLNEILFFSKTESGKLRVNYEDVVFEPFFEELLDSISPIYPDRKITFEVAPTLPSTLRSDPHLLSHIFQNLLTNALKYSPAESVVSLTLKRQGDHLVVTVKDQGIGIPEEDQIHLFEAFHRASNVGTRQGTGIGLSIAQRSAEHLKGTLEFQSKVGQGSTFTVILPLSSQIQTA